MRSLSQNCCTSWARSRHRDAPRARNCLEERVCVRVRALTTSRRRYLPNNGETIHSQPFAVGTNNQNKCSSSFSSSPSLSTFQRFLSLFIFKFYHSRFSFPDSSNVFLIFDSFCFLFFFLFRLLCSFIFPLIVVFY